MLTSLPPRWLHRLRDAAAALVVLAELGLAALCPCDGCGPLAARLHGLDVDELELERAA